MSQVVVVNRQTIASLDQQERHLLALGPHRVSGMDAGNEEASALEAHLQDRCQHSQHVLRGLLRMVADVKWDVADLLGLRHLRAAGVNVWAI